MSNEVTEFYAKFAADSGRMQKELPNAIAGFMGMFGKIMSEGALKSKEKELVAVGIAVSSACLPCIRLHVQKSVAAGAGRAEVLEAASVAIMMAGGPAFTHIPEVIEALDAVGV